MKTAVINVKTEPRIKREAQKTAKELGLSLSDVLNASLREFIIKKEVVYRLKPAVERQIERAMKDYKLGRNISPVFSNAKDMIAYLDRKR